MLISANEAKQLSTKLMDSKSDFLGYVNSHIIFNTFMGHYKLEISIPIELVHNTQFYINALQENGYNVELEENWLYITW